MPGSGVTALVARTLQSGWRDILPFVFALWLGEAIWLTCAILGLAAIAQTFHYVFLALRYIGILYLFYLAYKMWTAPTIVEPDALPTKKSVLGMFGAGIALSLGNPEIMILYIAILPSLIDINSVGINDWSILVTIMLIVTIFADVFWMVFATKLRSFFKTTKGIGLINKTSASMMAAAATAIAIRN